jgi:hypothetical protein
MIGVNIGIPVPREPFSFGGLYGTKSKYGDCDITGDGAMEFFTNRRKITSKWTASYSTAAAKAPGGGHNLSRNFTLDCHNLTRTLPRTVTT